MGEETEKNVLIKKNGGPAADFGSSGPDIMALCALAGAMFLWSGTFIAMKVVLTAFHPVFMVFVRMSVSTLLLLPFVRFWLRRTPYAPGDWRFIALLVICEPCLYFLFEGYALRYTSASQAGLVTALLPVLVGVSAYFALGERLSPKAWGGCALSVGGVALLTLTGDNSEFAPNAMLGNFLEFMAVLMACVYTLCVRRLKGYPPFFITAMQSMAGVVFFAAMCFVADAPLPDSMPPAITLFSLGFLAFSTIVAYGLYNFGIARLSASQAASWINLIPALTLFLGITLLGERLGPVQALAVLPIIGGVFLSQSKKR